MKHRLRLSFLPMVAVGAACAVLALVSPGRPLRAQAGTAAPAAKAEFPGEIRLSSGAVLRKTSLVRWTSDGVVVKHAGGADPIRFANVAEPDRSRLLAAKGESISAAREAASGPAKADRTVRGTVFVTTRGAGAYKFAGASVAAYPLDQLQVVRDAKAMRVSEDSNHVAAALHLEAWGKALEGLPIIAQTKTDADGAFELRIPGGRDVFLFCVESRNVGESRETNVWTIPVRASEDRVNLDGSAARTYYTLSGRTRR